MKLYLNDTSPFARLILICALEYNIKEIELIWVDPWEMPTNLLAINPFSTVPVLQLDNGDVLYESSIIATYLTSNSTRHTLLEYQRFALGKMLIETAFRHVSLTRYSPENITPHPFIARTEQVLKQALNTLSEYDLPNFSAKEAPDLASLQLAVALDYLTFRLPNLVQSYLHPKVIERLSTFQLRHSFALTTPEILRVKSRYLSK
ncbi:glutathione S-transferase family protein [Iningainema tapete]|uniref:Glutathione S-transferase N-terminal domain-containing protein n=1 Tax=Iningainema tapete BLCC-T55 TaxID=2748662 RepID=A0A8J6XKJ1_9CYAN|nr:glutathione S-transferase N-terminal domain-containing protein [Iningainema tapete]MBD2777894.1 glutathione S-transferase N-terminal domain-containing protein [Iningainema tapete BLCC-T55]